jgi:hypothetical protein
MQTTEFIFMRFYLTNKLQFTIARLAKAGDDIYAATVNQMTQVFNQTLSLINHSIMVT